MVARSAVLLWLAAMLIDLPPLVAAEDEECSALQLKAVQAPLTPVDDGEAPPAPPAPPSEDADAPEEAPPVSMTTIPPAVPYQPPDAEVAPPDFMTTDAPAVPDQPQDAEATPVIMTTSIPPALPYQPQDAEARQVAFLLAKMRREGRNCRGRFYKPNDGAFDWDEDLAMAALGTAKDQATRSVRQVQGHSGKGIPDFRGSSAFAGRSDPAVVASEFMQRSCTQLLNPDVTKIGVGHAMASDSPYKHYWVFIVAASGGSSCVDSKDPVTCQDWKTQGYCTDGRYGPYMTAHCRKTCGFCGESACVDIKSPQNCAGWKYQGYCSGGQYLPFMQGNCRKTCGFCGDCVDKKDAQSCTAWRKQGYCNGGEYLPFMRDNCKKTCGLCDGGCVDKNTQNCVPWMKLGYCNGGQYLPFMRDNCQKTCGFCV